MDYSVIVSLVSAKHEAVSKQQVSSEIIHVIKSIEKAGGNVCFLDLEKNLIHWIFNFLRQARRIWIQTQSFSPENYLANRKQQIEIYGSCFSTEISKTGEQVCLKAQYYNLS